MTAPDPMKGVRGVFAATLVLESIVVALALLLASGVQRRSWGLGAALGLQVAVLLCGILVPALVVIGIVFALVWGGLLFLRRDVALRMERGELPSQQVPEP